MTAPKTAKKSKKAKLESRTILSKRSASKRHIAVIGIAVLLTVVGYANATKGAFVYDDEFQIVKNPLIKPGGDLVKALSSDVWQFRAGVDEQRSNYWRPIFIAWLALNYRLFGTNPIGWHVMNILIHLLVTLLGYRLLLSMLASPTVAAIATWIFAAHPAHVQSVTWISGSPDLLMSLFLMGSMIAYLASKKTSHWGFRVAAVALFFCALLSKEAAISFVAVLLLTDFVLDHRADRAIQLSLAKSLKSIVPFAIAVVIFVVLRYSVLHSLRELAPGAPGLDSVLLTIPSMLIFYIRQIFLPFEFGPIYSVRYVNSTNVGLKNFLLPLILIAVLGYVARWLYKRETVYKFGLIWLFLPLMLVLDPRIFVPELLVQDRYVYLPVFGAAMLLAGGIIELSARVLRGRARSAELAVIWVGLLICFGLDLITLSINPVWANGVALWEHGVKVDPSSALANVQLANEYQRLGRLPEAKDAISRAIQLRPEMTSAYLTRGVIAVRERHFENAEADFTRVLNAFPTLDAPREQLALAYQQQGRFDESIALFDEGRRVIPAKQNIYTINIAVLHKLANRNAEALSDLESLLPVLNTTRDPDLCVGWWYLGELYLEQRRKDNAAAAYDRYLKATEGGNDPQVNKQRDLAAQRLSQIKK